MDIKDIAKLANVSITTVSRAINNKYEKSMKPETYERIQKIINEVGYTPDALASGLRKGIANVVAIIIPDNSNPYFATLCKYIEDQCFLHGYGTFFCNSNLDVERGKYYIKYLNSQKISGIILCNYGFKKEDIKTILKHNINLVLLGEKIKGIDCDFIGVDDLEGGYIAGQYLYELGHKDILVLKGPEKYDASSKRLSGFLKFIKEKKYNIKQENLIEVEATFESGYTTMARIIKKQLKYSAIFAFNDLVAIGAIKALNEKNLINKKHISIIGFDNIFIDELINPSLSTISDNPKMLAKKAVNLILRKLENNNLKPKSILLKPKLIIRDSCSEYKGT